MIGIAAEKCYDLAELCVCARARARTDAPLPHECTCVYAPLLGHPERLVLQIPAICSPLPCISRAMEAHFYQREEKKSPSPVFWLYYGALSSLSLRLPI